MTKILGRELSVALLKIALAKQKPIHDTPIGVIHPYWARKPLNIIDTIIKGLSFENDIVFDPFSGSGTIAFSTLSNGRRSIASDLNPLSVFITNSILDLSNFDTNELKSIEIFFNRVGNELSQWYKLDDDNIIERIRYEVKGSYKYGKFTLQPKELVVKKRYKNGWRGKDIHKVSSNYQFQRNRKYLNSPINFKKIKLQENSRIAVPAGALIAHFFDDLNKASINYIYSEISKLKTSKKVLNALFFILSSSIPLLRLSDKKASSQWPYWRPKNSLTSRNPLFIIEKKVKAFNNAALWAQEKYSGIKSVNTKTFFETKHKKNNHIVFLSPAQKIIQNGIPKESIDLILTDPPYADQVPYLEYSAMWNQLILNKTINREFTQEIVKTNAPTRRKDDHSYIIRLSSAFAECCKTLKYGGFFVFFYQDRNLKHWAEIHKIFSKNDVHILDVVPLPKQRRSMKTVTSPGRTLDGDLLVIAQKIKESKSIHAPKRPASKPNQTGITFFKRYATIIRDGLLDGSIEELSSTTPDVFSLLDNSAKNVLAIQQ